MSNNRAPLSIRFFIWVVAVTLGSAGMVSSGLFHDASAPTAASAAPVIASAGTSVKVSAEESAPGAWNAAACNPAANNPIKVGTAITSEMLDFNCIDLLVDKYCPTVDNPATAKDEAKGCDPDVFLPSTRWKDRLDNIMASQPGGWGNIGESVTYGFSTMIGGFLMSIAGLLWSLIFAVANFVSGLGNLSGGVGRKVNETFVLFAEALTSSGLIALVIFITAAVMIRQVLRIRAGGMPSGILSTLMTLALPMALLFSLSTAGAKSTQVVDGKTVAVESADPSSVFMSPVWLAQQGINLSEMPSALFGQRFSSSNPAFNKDKVVNPSCSAYTQVLAEAYKEAWKRKHPTQMSGASTAMVVNGLWNEAFMTFYNDGQFQNSFSGQRIVCHMLDGYSGISPAEQAVIAAAARYPKGANANMVKSVFNGATPASTDLRYFAPYMNMNGNAGMDDKRKYILPWAACAYNGTGAIDASSWALDPAWFYGSVAGDVNGNGNDKLSSAGCAKWWITGHDDRDGVTGLSGDEWTMLRYKKAKKDIIRGVQADPTAMAGMESSKTGACGTETCVAASNGVESLSGFSKTVLVTKGEIGGWLFSALMALVAACMYLYVLGGMFAGLLLAKVGFAMLLAVSPGILLLLAIPNVNGRKNSRGMKLLRMMIGWMVASALISTLIMVFALFISLIRGFIGSSGGGVMYIVSPALALVLLHFLMKAAGLGSLLSPTGALGLATGAATAAGTGNMKDMKKGQSKLDGIKKKGQDKAKQLQQKKQKLDRVRNASRNKGGKSYNDMKREDPDWARKNAANGLTEALLMKRAAKAGAKDAAGTSRKVKGEEKDAKRLADQKKADEAKLAVKENAAAAKMEKDAALAKPARDSRIDARNADPLQAGLQAAALAATADANGAFDRLQNVKADADLLGDFASSSDQAAVRVAAGTAMGATTLAVGHMGAGESQDAVSQASAHLATAGEGAHHALINQNTAAALGLTDATGKTLVSASGAPVLGFQDPRTGELVTPHTPQFAALAAATQAAASGGALGSSIEHGGVRYELSSAAGALGSEGRLAARDTLANEYGISYADVLVNRSGTLATIAPAVGASAIPGTTMVKAVSADGQVEVARNITQYFDKNTNDILNDLPPASRAVAIETIVQTLSVDGRPPDALALVGISESQVRSAHAGGDADMKALLDGKTFDVPGRVLTAAIAEASTARSIVTLSPMHTAAVHDISIQSGRSLANASQAVTAVEVIAESTLLRGKSDPTAQEECYKQMLAAMGDLTVVKTAAVSVDGAARNSMDAYDVEIDRIVSDHKAKVEQMKVDYKAAQAIIDPGARDAEITKVLLQQAKEVSEEFKRAERSHEVSVDRVLESIGTRRSRASVHQSRTHTTKFS
jgi:hypothetical protein